MPALNGVDHAQNTHAAELQRCLVDCDVAVIRKLWRHISPHLPQPATDHDALMTIHMARTQSPMMTLKLRAYSHRWLTDNGFPSQLPDYLKPSAERMYPRIVDAVGISVNSKSAVMRPIAKLVQTAMEDTVSDAYANRVRPTDARIREMMFRARAWTIQKLLG